jgi:peptidoglycan hydrolase-like protein with peptidoglycan-binding domain
MKKRIVVLVGVAVIVVGAVLLARGGSDSSTSTNASYSTSTAAVRDLTRTETLTGVVAYKDLRDLSSPQTGIITHLPAVGQDLKSGDVLMSINDAPVVLLNGPVPAWRDMKPGMADGTDVQQLESSLLALGYGKAAPDTHWDANTTAAVKQFQAKVGAPVDGALSLGEVVFTSGNVHVAKLDGHVGGLATPDQSVLAVQSTDRVVLLDLDPLNRDLIIVNIPVQVELPSGDKAPGKITAVSTTLQTNADGKNVFSVTVTLDNPSGVSSLALAPVTVHYVATVAKQVLSVPVSAIIGVPGGGYAVDTVDASTKRIPVQLGAWGDGYVQVTGELPVGTTVEVPK